MSGAPANGALQELTPPNTQPERAEEPGIRAQPLHAHPAELFEVTRVVDGDTIHITRAGETEKLRLLSVDTEEVIRGGSSSATKPQTVFGTECAAWAQSYFEDLEDAQGVAKVGLWFPDGREARDIYGRLLCHVVLEDGTDFNLLLLEEGKSPYFNKYGDSKGFDAEFRAAQRAAQAAGIGIWDPSTNAAKTVGAPSAKRPYQRLMPWWEARAQAINRFRAKHAAAPHRFVDASAPEQLEAVTRASDPEPARVEVFGALDRIFNEEDGSRTVLFRTSDRRKALRVRIPKEQVDAHASLGLDELNGEFRQNYVWVTGALSWTGRGYDITSNDPASWRVEAYPPEWVDRLFEAVGAREEWAAARGAEYDLAIIRRAAGTTLNKSHVWVSFMDASSRTETELAGSPMTVVIGSDAGWSRTTEAITAYPTDLCEMVRARVRTNLYLILHLLASGAVSELDIDDEGRLTGRLPAGERISLEIGESGHPATLTVHPGDPEEQIVRYAKWMESGKVSFATHATRAGETSIEQNPSGFILHHKALDPTLFERP